MTKTTPTQNGTDPVEQKVRQIVQKHFATPQLGSNSTLMQMVRESYEAGRAEGRRERDEVFSKAGVEFCECGHLNIEHYAGAGWMDNPNVPYPCGFKGCDCSNFAAIRARLAEAPAPMEGK